MKILLINPPTCDRKGFVREGRCTQERGAWGTLWPPITLATIGAVLERGGHEVEIADCAAKGDDWDDLDLLLRRSDPRLVLLSTGTPSINNDLSLCGHIKKGLPGIRTAVFGTHVTELDIDCMERYPGIDFIIRNEPEETSLELANAVETGRDPGTIQGVTYRNNSGGITRNPARPFIEDLDRLPFPAWEKLDIDLYRLPLKGTPYLLISPSRGCPYLCTFCTCQTFYGNRSRRRSVGSIVSELEHGVERFGIRDFFFWAETFVLDRKFVRDISDGILKNGLKISWTANARVDTVDQETLDLMAKAGCWMLSFGIESMDQSVLDGAKKGIKVEQAAEAVVMARKAGIKTAGHFILGLPGDTEGSIERTIDKAMALDLDFAQFYSAVPFPGSELYREAVAKNWITSESFEEYSQDNAMMHLPSLNPERVNHFRKLAYKRFYISAKSFGRALRLINWSSIKRIPKLLIDFFQWTLHRR